MLGLFSTCDAPAAELPEFVRLKLRAGGAEPAGTGRVAVAAGSGPPLASAQVEDLAIVMTGTLRDRARLARELGADRTPDPDAGDARLLAMAYRRWGPDGLARPRGRYAAVLWDDSAGQGALTSDVLAVQAMFVHRGPAAVAFATELPDLVALLPAHPVPDPVAMTHWLGDGTHPPELTLFSGIARLGVGELTVLARGSVQNRVYWRPRYRHPTTDGCAELAAGLAGELRRAIGSRLSPRCSGVILSGGIDSSVVTAIAAGERPDGAQLRSYSGVFPGAAYDETSKIRQVVDAAGVEPVALDIAPQGSVWLACTHARRWQVPLLAQGALIDVAATTAAAADGAEVVLDGQFGDELFGSAPYLVADRLRHGRLLAALELAGKWPVGRPITPREKARVLKKIGVVGAVPHRLRRLRRASRARRGPEPTAPPWLSPAHRRAFLEQEDPWLWQRTGPGPLWWRYLADSIVAMPQRELRIDYLHDRAAAVGTAGDPPLYDVDLIEYTLGLPPEVAFDRRFTRPLVRQAMRGALPERIRLQQRKANFTAFAQETMSGPDAAPIEWLLTSGDLRVGDYLDVEAVRIAWAEVRARRGEWQWLTPLWRVVATECWLRSHSEPGFVDEMLARTDVEEPAARRVDLPG